ncbi:restriction endonuclease, partial [Candidatus Poribacteria bacterium]|nr:restriction endonuclease [Candidatus Poribacteria bacterium]
LQQIKNNTPAFIEELVIDLNLVMGYGGSREDAQAVGRSGDGGIDGIIKADPLGLNVVYIQAKRWEGNVGAPPMRDFVGALDGEGVQDGIFITTSDFNPAAKEFAERSSKRVILINGDQLAEYMIKHNVGVSTTKTYEIKRVDSDYFAENTENA